MAKPKLCLIPAAQGSKLFSVLPSSGVGDFNFSRSGSATRINSQGLIEEVSSGQSRLNYPMIDGKVVGCPHHILEPQRTNSVPYSEDFSQWNLIGITVTSNSVISPNGSLNASKLVATSGSSNKVIAQSISAGTYTASVFAKKGEFEGLFIGTGTVGAFFNLNTHTFRANYTSAPTSYKIEEYGNGWYRYSVTFTISSSDNLYIGPNDNVSNTLAITGNGANGIYTWGAQLEQGSYPTSYIKTNGESGGVTRSAETANGAGDAATFNDSEGVLMAEISALADSTSESVRRLSLSNGTNDNRIQILFSNVVGRIGVIVKSGGLFQIDTGFLGYNTTNSNKIAVRYGSGVFKVYINGLSVFNDAGVSFSSISLNNLRFSNPSGSEIMYSKTKQLQYYDSSLTDSELEQLTSWTSFTDMAEGQLYTIE